MTLKEKFDNLDYFDSVDIFNNLSHDSHECEKIADDYAIEFGEWLLSRAVGEDGLKLRDDILEIFKKEKGL